MVIALVLEPLSNRLKSSTTMSSIVLVTLYWSTASISYPNGQHHLRQDELLFIYPSVGWTINCVRDGARLKEHIARFKEGKYHGAILLSEQIKQYIILDIWSFKPSEARGRSYILYLSYSKLADLASRHTLFVSSCFFQLFHWIFRTEPTLIRNRQHLNY